MFKIFTYVRTVVIALSILMSMTQKAMIIPIPLLLQKTLLVSTYGYGIWSLAQHYNWLPKSMLWKNRQIEKTKKDIEKQKVKLETSLIDLFTLAQRKAYFKERERCYKHAPHIAPIAEKNSLALMLVPLTWSFSIAKPLFAYNI
jgi:hypothetical protein